jgi:DNA-directed RNA polymerase specialized sigma24 family protein
MRESQLERRRRFDALFASYSSDIVAYCSWRAASASDAQDAVADASSPPGTAGALRPRAS